MDQVPDIETILVYSGLERLGDGLMKLPFLRALRRAWPAARITWLAGKGPSVYGGVLAPLVRGLIDELVEDAGAGRSWRELLSPPLAGTPLAGRRFDMIIDSQRRVPTALILRRIPHRLFVSGAAGFLLSDRKPPGGARKSPALARQLLDMLELASGRPADPSFPLDLEPRLLEAAEALLPEGPTYLGLAPGAGARHKCWPLERYVELATDQQRRGRVPVFLLGPAEADWAGEIAAALPTALLPEQDPRAGAAGGSPLLTIALGRRLAAAVANDSGAGHLLAAAGCPLVSLFGPSSPAKFAPLANALRVVAARDFAGGPAMTAISVEAVARALEDVIRDHGPAAVLAR